jgi:hypothetical protein
MQLAGAIFKKCMCLMLCSASFGCGKVHAFKELVGRQRFWVAGFGVCAEVASRALLGPPCSVLQHVTAPWLHSPMEMWHLARYVTWQTSQKLSSGRHSEVCMPVDVRARLLLNVSLAAGILEKVAPAISSQIFLCQSLTASQAYRTS